MYHCDKSDTRVDGRSPLDTHRQLYPEFHVRDRIRVGSRCTTEHGEFMWIRPAVDRDPMRRDTVDSRHPNVLCRSVDCEVIQCVLPFCLEKYRILVAVWISGTNAIGNSGVRHWYTLRSQDSPSLPHGCNLYPCTLDMAALTTGKRRHTNSATLHGSQRW
ncbi:hypothetical protein BC629DRAFT_1516052 [Irpex lacteus]|nr:hypothetical protein BC629DRAFT_1516052 [Irpex lacteus]